MSAESKVPVGWDRLRIGECASVKRGASPRPIEDAKWWGGEIGWVRISDVTSARKYLRKTRDYLSAAGVRQSVEIKVGEVVMSICATIGRSIITTTPVCIHDGFVWFDGLGDHIDREYFYYYLASKEAEFSGHRQMGTQGNLNTTIVSNVDLLIPKSKPEQTKIAEILSTVDRAIEQTEALIAKQQRLKTGLMQDLLTRGIDEHGNLRSEHTHQFKDSPLGRIPVEWEVVPLSHYVARLDAGVSVNADDTPCGAAQIGVLKTSALSKGRFLSEQNKSVIRDDISRVRTPLRANTVLVSRMNTPALVGESAYIDRDYPELFLPDRIWMTVFQDGMESAARWIGFILTSPSARNYISLNATGTSGSMKNLPKKSLLSMPIASPNTLEEVNRITQVLIRFEMNGNGNDSQLSKLRSLKTALMQDLLIGRKRVTDLLTASPTP